MILSIFKKSRPASFLLVPVTALIFFILGWMGDSGLVIINPMPFYNLFLWMVSPLPIWSLGVIALLMVLLQVFHFNKLIEKHEILYKNSYLPGWFYLIFSILIPSFVSFHPILFANTISLFALDKIFRIYKNPNPQALIFDAGLLFSLASLFYLPSVLFFVFLAASLLVIKTFNLREWIIGFAGLLIPYLLILVWYFFTGTMDEFISKLTYRPLTNLWNTEGLLLEGYRATIIVVVILFLLALWKLRANYFKNVIRIRRYQQVMLMYLLIGFCTMAISPSEDPYRFAILVPPVALLIAYYFLAIRKEWLTEVLFGLLFIVLLVNYIYPMIS